MKTYRFSSLKATTNDSMFDLMSNISKVLESFENVKLVEIYNVSASTKRYLYEIDGFDYDYLYMYNSSSSIVCGFILRTASHGTSYRFSVSYTTNVSYSACEVLLYTISNENILKSFALTSPALTTPIPSFITFDIEKDKSYVLYNDGTVNVPIAECGLTFSKKYIHLYEPYLINCEKVIKRKPMVKDTTASPSTFYDTLKNVYIFSNSQFLENATNMTSIPCVSIDGDRYRQVYRGCIFIEDGD